MRTPNVVILMLGLVGCSAPHLDPTVPDGLQSGGTEAYVDKGIADRALPLRALISLKVRDEAGLDATIATIYDPTSAQFRQYLDVDTVMSRHAPLQEDVDYVSSWLAENELSVARVATNRLLLQVLGTVGAFNDLFATELHTYAKFGDDEFVTYGTVGQDALRVPADIAERVRAVVVADPPAPIGDLPGEGGSIVTDPPPDNKKMTLATISRAYGIDQIAATGANGEGVTLAVVVGALFKFKDVQSFWRGQGITRADPEVVETMEPPITRFTETTLDVEWSGGIAPGADLIVYSGPDSHDTSLVYTFNAAVAEGRADVISDSFAHREDATPKIIREQYDIAAKLAAAMGITIVAASGDSGEPDVPSSCPHVTSVGGTVLDVDDSGARVEERGWVSSGSGDSSSFAAPVWQLGLPISATRASSDVSLASGSSYWVYSFGDWGSFIGTSFASPVFAGMLAVIDSARLRDGKPNIGFLNSLLYTSPQVQGAFNDITAGGTAVHPAGPGWDYPTGWGSPDATRLLNAIP